MELNYRPEYDSFRIECNRSEYEAVLEAVRWMVRWMVKSEYLITTWQ
jgi:hypothetical protein